MDTRAGLSLDQAPPISVPFRFFVTAPLFGILAALLLLYSGPDSMTNRWAPATLAATHLVTLGYITMVMVGAISQVLPVLVGVPIPQPLVVGSVVHALLSLGVLCLAGGLFFANSAAIHIALVSLALGFLVFLAATAYCLSRARASNATVNGIRLAILSLLITIALGLRLTADHVWIFSSPLPKLWTDVHLAWGLVGWVAILVIGMAYEVVPMFQMTPLYPRWLKRPLTGLIFVCLVLWSIIYLSHAHSIAARLISGLLAFGLGLFACLTLYLQSRRRRRRFDIILQFWRLALFTLLACALFWSLTRFWTGAENWEGRDYLLGVLFIAGFIVSVIHGMLYKIVPFLIWLHLQSLTVSYTRVPNMKEIISDRRIRSQFYIHLVSLGLLALIVIQPAWFTYPAAIMFALSSMFLFANILTALRRYRAFKLKLMAPD